MELKEERSTLPSLAARLIIAGVPLTSLPPEVSDAIVTGLVIPKVITFVTKQRVEGSDVNSIKPTVSRMNYNNVGLGKVYSNPGSNVL